MTERADVPARRPRQSTEHVRSGAPRGGREHLCSRHSSPSRPNRNGSPARRPRVSALRPRPRSSGMNGPGDGHRWPLRARLAKAADRRGRKRPDPRGLRARYAGLYNRRRGKPLPRVRIPPCPFEARVRRPIVALRRWFRAEAIAPRPYWRRAICCRRSASDLTRATSGSHEVLWCARLVAGRSKSWRLCGRGRRGGAARVKQAPIGGLGNSQLIDCAGGPMKPSRLNGKKALPQRRIRLVARIPRRYILLKTGTQR